jgi:hypothetical protein
LEMQGGRGHGGSSPSELSADPRQGILLIATDRRSVVCVRYEINVYGI